MSSLKTIDKKIAKRRQVYKPVLESPFTNETHLWPRVEEQQFVMHLLENTLLTKCKLLKGTPRIEWPWDILTEFNDIVSYLSQKDGSKKEDVLLFVCNKDPGIASVLLQQLPLLSYMSIHEVTLVQLPKGSHSTIEDYLPLPDGMLLVRCNDRINDKFLKQIKTKVDELQFPWLHNVKYQTTDVKVLKTSMPIGKK